MESALRRKEFAFLAVLTFFALLIHGYHPGAEDSETYLPGVESILHPKLFPVGREYFQLHAHLTLFPRIIAESVWLSHLPLAWVLFLWQIASIFLFLFACRVLAGKLFADPRAIWGGVVLMTALLTLPVAGTALYVMDQYINPRNMTAFAVVFAVVYVLEKKYWRAAIFLILAACIHPFMTSFAVSYCFLLGWMGAVSAKESSQVAERTGAPAVSFAWILPQSLSAIPKGYHTAAISHSYQYFLQWHWYAIVGAFVPLGILWWCRQFGRKNRLRNLELVSISLVIYGAFYCAIGILFSSSAVFEDIARLQPMRSLYLLYILLVLIGGGLLAKYILRDHMLRWLALFVPLVGGMFFVQRSLFPASAHIEWPWASAENPWAQSFQWVRMNTPQNAVFAIDPHYMNIKGEDADGFRAIAQRSQLADAGKDAGVVEMFPEIADSWLAQVQAQTGLQHFDQNDFRRLKTDFGVNWVILQQPGNAILDCPYSNRVVKVCNLH
jgi:hypothetical protein